MAKQHFCSSSANTCEFILIKTTKHDNFDVKVSFAFPNRLLLTHLAPQRVDTKTDNKHGDIHTLQSILSIL